MHLWAYKDMHGVMCVCVYRDMYGVLCVCMCLCVRVHLLGEPGSAGHSGHVF